MVEALLLGLLLATMCSSVRAYPVVSAAAAALGSDSETAVVAVPVSSAWPQPWASQSAAAPSSAAAPFTYSYSVADDSIVGDSDTVLRNSVSANVISTGNRIAVSSSIGPYSGHRPEEEMPVRNERSTNLSAQIYGTARKMHFFIMNRLLQIAPDGVVNGTYDDTKYTILQRITTGRGQLLIQGVETCQYLCMDSCGFLYGSRKATNECIFNEMLGADNYNTYSSTKYSNGNRTLYMALNRNGQPRKVLLRANHSLGGLATFTRVLTRPVTHERMLHMHLRHSHHNHRCGGPVAPSLDISPRLQAAWNDDATPVSGGSVDAGAADGLAPSHSPVNHLQCRRRRWRRKKKRRKQPHPLQQSITRLINSSNINDSISNIKCSSSSSNSSGSSSSTDGGNNEECQRKDGSRGPANRKGRRGKVAQRKKLHGPHHRRLGSGTVNESPTVASAAVPVASPADDAEEDVGDSSTQAEWDEHDTTAHADLLSDLSPYFQTELEDSSAIMTHAD